MILSDRDIRAALAAGEIVIDPLREDMFKNCSYMLAAGRKAFVLDTSAEPIDMRKKQYPYREVTLSSDGYVIEPGAFVNIQSAEKLTLGHTTAAFLSTRGRVAQVGLNVLMSSLFVEPGTDNNIVIECHNVGLLPLKIFPGVPLVKCVFMQVLSETEGKGRGDDFFKRHALS